ncbi:MAG: hypothetical protein PHV82_03785 [Victivallaceae bacterium]|nr:hypothetical protein [Victivallaceae bacterium]
MEENGKECSLCHGTGSLTCRGILVIYLLAAKVPLLIILVSLIGAITYSRYFYLMLGLGMVLPLARADFRMYLYPVALIAKLAGKKLNCPRCNPQGGMFRRF